MRIFLQALASFCLPLLAGSVVAGAQTKAARPGPRIDTGNSASWTYNLQP